ncbi:CAP domain-containing protein [Ideonella sp.]|uniref:CAP domain-containing protein n=1 Tax=Ideonella sp. TaxID=1929293 RepID=UPI0035B3BAC1
MRLPTPCPFSIRPLAAAALAAACGLAPWGAVAAPIGPVVSSDPPALVRGVDDAAVQSGEAVAAAPAEASTLASATCSQSGTKPFRQEFVKLTNSYRATGRYCGSTWYAATKPVAWDKALKRAATGHSRDMATHDFFSHTGSDGSSMGDRITDAGYRWSAAGENIAAGYNDAASVMKGWIESPGHCANIMNPRYVDLGVACAESASSQYRTYWTMDLAAPL